MVKCHLSQTPPTSTYCQMPQVIQYIYHLTTSLQITATHQLRCRLAYNPCNNVDKPFRIESFWDHLRQVIPSFCKKQKANYSGILLENSAKNVEKCMH